MTSSGRQQTVLPKKIELRKERLDKDEKQAPITPISEILALCSWVRLYLHPVSFSHLHSPGNLKTLYLSLPHFYLEEKKKNALLIMGITIIPIHDYLYKALSYTS